MENIDSFSARKLTRHLVRWLMHHKKLPLGAVAISILIIILGLYIFQNKEAAVTLEIGKKLDNTGRYAQARQELMSASKPLVRPSMKQQIAVELRRNQRLADIQSKLNEINSLLKQHNTAGAQKLLQSVRASLPVNSNKQSSQIAALQQTIKHFTPHNSSAPSSSSASSNPPSSGSGSSGGSSDGSGSGGAPPAGPMTSLSIVSLAANANPATASTCTISDLVTFSANGSGSVTVTWSLLSTKTTSQIVNPNTFNFPAAGSQTDNFNFSNTQGLESGDSYRVGVTVTSVSNPGISVTAGPVDLSSCAAPPALAAEQVAPFMTAITAGSVSVFQSQDGIFSNECSVEVTTPYSVNSSGTVEAIVMVTSGSSIGYTYYDKNGATAFNAPMSTSDTSFFRLPHLPGGGHYDIAVKLVEVSSPNTVVATTSPVDAACN